MTAKMICSSTGQQLLRLSRFQKPFSLTQTSARLVGQRGLVIPVAGTTKHGGPCQANGKSKDRHCSCLSRHWPAPWLATCIPSAASGSLHYLLLSREQQNSRLGRGGNLLEASSCENGVSPNTGTGNSLQTGVYFRVTCPGAYFTVKHFLKLQ